MTNIDLRKQILLDLKKKKGIDSKAQIVVAMDYSWSMMNLYRTGFVQRLVDRLFPVAMAFDDNEEFDFFLFDHGVSQLAPVTKDNYPRYIEENVSGHMGGTNYAPVLKAIADNKLKSGWFLGFGRKDVTPEDPIYVIFITDGDNSDHGETNRVIRDLSKKGIFIQFVGIGGASFDYLRKLDDLDGRLIDNCNFFAADDIEKMSDEVLYDKLLTEFPGWIPQARSHKLIK